MVAVDVVVCEEVGVVGHASARPGQHRPISTHDLPQEHTCATPDSSVKNLRDSSLQNPIH